MSSSAGQRLVGDGELAVERPYGTHVPSSYDDLPLAAVDHERPLAAARD